jgi:hypothetical protein
MAADSNSWTLPGKGILGGVNLSIGTSKQDDSNSEYESAWARALREAIENLPGGDADRLAMAEQVRASHTGPIDPLAHPAAALINRLRQPSAPPQMPQTRPAGPEPYIAPRPDDVLGGIGKSIIEHHADYFDPWVRDEQGRRVIDTPAAYTPNEAMKLPETRKPWWMPLAGGAEIASNFIAPGAGAAGKVAMAAASIGGSGKGGRIGRLAMDEASRMTRARKLGYADEPFYRGERSGETPTEFSKGAHFSRDKDCGWIVHSATMPISLPRNSAAWLRRRTGTTQRSPAIFPNWSRRVRVSIGCSASPKQGPITRLPPPAPPPWCAIPSSKAIVRIAFFPTQASMRWIPAAMSGSSSETGSGRRTPLSIRAEHTNTQLWPLS